MPVNSQKKSSKSTTETKKIMFRIYLKWVEEAIKRCPTENSWYEKIKTSPKKRFATESFSRKVTECSS